MEVKKQVQLELDMKQLIGSKLGREYDKTPLPPAYLTYAEYTMQNARLGESEARSKIVRRNDNIRYVDGTTLMAESEEEQKSLLMEMKEESEKTGLKLTVQKTKIIASSSITSLQIEGEKVETEKLYFLGLQNHCGLLLQP